ncbi:hypothetical protein [Lysobacter sp. CA199]
MSVPANPQMSRKAGQGWRWWRTASVSVPPSSEDFLRDIANDFSPRGR